MSKGVSQKSLRRTIQALLERDLFAIRAPVVRPEDTPVHERTTAFWRGVLASGALAITLDAIWAYFAVAGLVHLGSARAILAFAWLVGTAGIALSTLVWGKPFVYRMRLISAGSALLALALLGVDAWTVHHRPAEVHAINWMDFPTALIDRIADAVDRRVAPRFAELKKGAETSKPAPQESLRSKTDPPDDLFKQLQDPVLVIDRTGDTVGFIHSTRPAVFSLQIHNDGVADVRDIDVYYDAFTATNVRPLVLQPLAPFLDSSDAHIASLKAGSKTLLTADFSKVIPAVEDHRQNWFKYGNIYMNIARVMLVYRRRADGKQFTDTTSFRFALEFLLRLDSGRRLEIPMLGSGTQMPTNSEIKDALMYFDQSRH